MIVECEQCHTKYHFDEGLLKKRGTKLRCSKCGHVFKHTPKESAQAAPEPVIPEDMEETVLPDDAFENLGKEAEWDFDEAFQEEAMEDIHGLEAGYDDAAPVVDEPKKERGAMEETVADISPRPEKPLEPVAPKKKAGGFRKIMPTILIILLLTALGYGAYRWGDEIYQWGEKQISGALTPPPTETADTSMAVDIGGNRLEVLTYEGIFVETRHLGRLFLVRGKLVNHYPQPRSYLRVKASILDGMDNVIQEKQAYAGNPFTKEQLQKMSMAEMESDMNTRTGVDNANVDVPPGTSMDYAVVFEPLSDQASDFEVGPVSSSPGSVEPGPRP